MYTPISIMVAPVKHDAWFMFHSLQCTMVNPFVAGSSVLFTFIEIMETILKKLLERVNNLWEGVRESFQIKWLRKLLSMSEQKHDQAPFWDQNAGYFNKANNAILFYSGEKKNCLKKFNKRLEFCFNSIQNSHVHEPRKLAENLPHLHILPQSKTKPKKPRIQCLEIHCLHVLLT